MQTKSLATMSAMGSSMLATALILSMGAAKLPAADLSGQYTWDSVMVGGGGWGALVFESPAAPGVVYFKDDCSSIYRLDKGATVWKKLNTWGSLPAGLCGPGARSGANIACAANDPNRAYMSYDRNLFYSDDKGDSWKKGTLSPPLNFMNEVDNPQPQRGCDSLRRLQRLVVDPNNKDVAYYGSSFDGLYRTTDGGANWSKLTNGLPAGVPVKPSADTGGFINTAFDKSGGTVDGRTKIVWATCRTVGVYRSTDGGDSFALVPQTQPIYYTTAACDAAGTFYVAAGSDTNNDGKIYKCATGRHVDGGHHAVRRRRLADHRRPPFRPETLGANRLVRARLFGRRRQDLDQDTGRKLGYRHAKTCLGTRPRTARRAWSDSRRIPPTSCGSLTAMAAWGTARALGPKAT